MLRVVATPRGAALTAVAVLLAAAMAALGVWQWERSRPVVDAASLDTVPVTDLVPDTGRVTTADQGAPVSVTGTWRPDRELLVADRADPAGSGEPGRWVVTAVEVRAGAGDDPAVLLPVVRGWVPSGEADAAQQVPSPPAGSPARVTGWVQASEPLDNPAETLQPAGVVPLLAAADLVNRWPERVLDAFVLAGDGPGTDPAALVGVETAMPGPVQAARGTRDWRNVAYAAQWWVFAGFVAVLWWRAMGDVGSARSPGSRGSRHEGSGMKGALLRYRVIAWIVGVFLLVLTFGVVARYTDWLWFRTDVISRTVSPVHGFGYMLYLAAALDLAVRCRWQVARTLAVMLAGTVPLLSFVAERSVTRQVTALLREADPAAPATTRAPS